MMILRGGSRDDYADTVIASVRQITATIIADLEANRTLAEAQAADGGDSQAAVERILDKHTQPTSRPGPSELN
jgi:hypothetical protein